MHMSFLKAIAKVTVKPSQSWKFVQSVHNHPDALVFTSHTLQNVGCMPCSFKGQGNNMRGIQPSCWWHCHGNSDASCQPMHVSLQLWHLLPVLEFHLEAHQGHPHWQYHWGGMKGIACHQRRIPVYPLPWCTQHGMDLNSRLHWCLFSLLSSHQSLQS